MCGVCPSLNSAVRSPYGVVGKASSNAASAGILYYLGRIALQDRNGERGPCTGRALDSDVAAKELCQVPRNRQPKPRAAVLARGAIFGLAELLEYQLLRFCGYADACGACK